MSGEVKPTEKTSDEASGSQPIVAGFAFALVYVDELRPSQDFYEKHLGFEKTAEFAPGEIYGRLGEVEMWIGAGYERADGGRRATRATVMLRVDSVGKLFDSLAADGVEMMDAPVEMQPGTFWLQFHDPAGNVLEVLGER